MMNMLPDPTAVPKGRVIQEWWSGTINFLMEKWHLAAAAIIAILCIVAGFFGLHEKELSEATLGVLAAVTLALAKERSQRRNLEQTTAAVATAVQNATTAIEALKSSRPYRVADLLVQWDLDDAGGGRSTKLKSLKFEQDGVSTLRDWALAEDGATESDFNYTIDDQTVEPFASLRSPGKQQTEKLIFLQRIFNRGDSALFSSRRTLAGAFTGRSEYVSVTIQEPTSRVRMVVSWAATKPPSKVVYEVWNNDVRELRVDVTDEVCRAEDGRRLIDHATTGAELDTVHQLVWDW